MQPDRRDVLQGEGDQEQDAETREDEGDDRGQGDEARETRDRREGETEVLELTDPVADFGFQREELLRDRDDAVAMRRIGRLDGLDHGAFCSLVAADQRTHFGDEAGGALLHRLQANHGESDGCDGDEAEKCTDCDPHLLDAAVECGEAEQKAGDTEDDSKEEDAAGEGGGSPDQLQHGIHGSLCELIEIVATEPAPVEMRVGLRLDGRVLILVGMLVAHWLQCARSFRQVQTGRMQNLADLPFIDELARDRLTVEGEDAQSYLQSQIAQEIRDMEVGEARWTLVLEPTGKVDVLARLTRSGDTTFVLDTDAGFGAAMEARINRFKIRVKADSTLVAAEQSEPSVDHEAARIAAGWPRMGTEIVPGETIPAVTGVVALAVNFTKGCYPGQELVERMDSRGADAPKSLRIIEVPDGTSVGATIDDVVITSVSGTTALAYVQRGSELGTAPAHTL